jgi:hypothetical protein
VVSFVSYFLLGLGVRFITFLVVVTFINYFLLLRRARGWRVLFIVRWGKFRGWKFFFFFLPDVWKGGRRRGERGTFRVQGNVFFIVEWLGRGSPRVIFRVKFIMGRRFRVHWGKGCTLIFFLLLGGGGGWWRIPKSRGETKLKVSQSQVAESRHGSTLPASNSKKG